MKSQKKAHTRDIDMLIFNIIEYNEEWDIYETTHEVATRRPAANDKGTYRARRQTLASAPGTLPPSLLTYPLASSFVYISLLLPN